MYSDYTMNYIMKPVYKPYKVENTPSCVVTGTEMVGINSIDYFLHTQGLCSLNTPGNSLHSLGVPKTGLAGHKIFLSV